MNVVFIIFRRPELTKCVFEQIAKVKPDNLFINAAGPGDGKDRGLSKEPRSVVDDIDWDCNVRRNYSDKNMGCRERVISGLDWVFSQVEDAIILEDDCLPDLTFFSFCCELLEKYRDDERIGNISGGNFDLQPSDMTYSYQFSQFRFIWGWATWRRSWLKYDKNMEQWPLLKERQWHHNIFSQQEAIYYYEDIWDDIQEGKLDTWGIPWFFTGLAESSLSIVPNRNLISNIGFGVDGTHTIENDPRVSNRPRRSMLFPLKYPGLVIRNKKYDKILERRVLLPYKSIGKQWRNNISNIHFYGECIRKTPVVGALWNKWRSKIR